MGLFRYWSRMAAEDLFGMYNKGVFVDYPPLYLGVLGVIARIGNLFKMDFDSKNYTLLLKLPTVLAQLASALILYRASRMELGGVKLSERISEPMRLFIVSLYLFNPAVIVSSELWGQVDPVLALLVIIGMFRYFQGKYWSTGVFYALAILCKPQGIIFLPGIFLVMLYRFIFGDGTWDDAKAAGAKRSYNWESAKAAGKALAGAAITVLVVVFPFALKNGPLWIFNLYAGTLTGYEYGTVNAFNFFALVGGNWVKNTTMLGPLSYKAWGAAAMVLAVAVTAAFVFLACGKGLKWQNAAPTESDAEVAEENEIEAADKPKGKLARIKGDGTLSKFAPILLTATALLNLTVVTFGHNMHERYFFPTLLLLLASYLMNRRFSTLIGFVWLSASGFLNVSRVLAEHSRDVFTNFYYSNTIYFISAANVLVALFLWWDAFNQINTTKKPRSRRAPKVAAALALVVLLTLAPSLTGGSATAFAARDVKFTNAGFEDSARPAGDKVGSVPGWVVFDYSEQYEDNSAASIISYDVGRNGSAAAIKLQNVLANDVRVYQKVKVDSETLYKFTAYAKAEGVGDGGKGANISVMGMFACSEDVRDTNGEYVELVMYGKTGKGQKTVEISFGLGGYGNIAVGTAWFDDVSVERLDSAPHGVNVQDLFNAPASNDQPSQTSAPNVLTKSMRALFILILAALLALCVRFVMKAPGNVTDGAIETTRVKKRLLTKRDRIVIIAMTAVYLALALVRLGGTTTPETYWKSAAEGESLVFDFGSEPVTIERLMYHCGLTSVSDSSYKVEYMDEYGAYNELVTLSDKSFYAWKSVSVSTTTTRIRLTAIKAGMTMTELAFVAPTDVVMTLDGSGHANVLPVTIAEDNTTAVAGMPPANLLDEQGIVPDRPDVMNGTYFDEVYFPRTAYEFIHGNAVYETSHPPLGKVITAFGILIFGMNPFGWRIMGTLAGVAMLPVMYMFGKKLFGKSFYGFCAAFLMMFDFMHFAQTRISTIDSYATLLIILSYYFMYDAFMGSVYNSSVRATLKPLLLCGLMFGLGAASKWIGLYAGAGLAFVLFLGRARELRDFGKSPSIKKPRGWLASLGVQAGEYAYRKKLLIMLAGCVVFFIVIPGLIYTLSYIPYTFPTGESRGLIGIMLSNQKLMFNYHSQLTATHPFESAWWKWPLMVKPIWYYAAQLLPSGLHGSISSFGNPLVWWVGIPCLVASFFIAYRKRDKHMALVFVAIILQYGPWMFITRATFIYHFFSSVPFMIFAIVYIIKTLLEGKIIPKGVVYGYLALTALLFVLYYPLLSGLPTSAGYSDALKIFSPWYW
jgi:Gpi18-like mannosyltransferase